MKLLLTMIVKDDSEAELFKRCLDSFMPHFDGLAVAITGLGEKTKLEELVTEHKGTYVVTSPETHPQIYSEAEGKPFFANFAEARNVSFELASSMDGFDWWTWADVDDVLIGGEELRNAAENAPNVDAVFFTYWYAVKQNEKGAITDVVIEHQRERLLKPNVFKWVSRLHEVALPKEDAYKPTLTEYPKEAKPCVWAHLPTRERANANLKRNIQILELQALEEKHKDPRTIFYLARTYVDLADEENKPEYRQLAELLLHQYLELSGWPEERANAWEYLGNLAALRGDHRAAVDAYHNGIKEYPVRHLLYLLLAREYAEMGQREVADWWLDMAMKLEPPAVRTTIGNPLDIKLMAVGLKYNQAIRDQKVEDAIYWLKILQKLRGTEDDGMLTTLEDAKLMNDAGMWAFNLAKYLKDHGQADKITHLLDAIPTEMKQETFVQHLANEVLEPRVWGEDEITYFAASMFEPWSDLSLSSGLGGSETAIVQLSKEWAKLGYKVTVFCYTEDEGTREGVTYRHMNTINWHDTFNMLIIWRNPGVLDLDIKAKQICYDAHDIEAQTNWTDARMERVDKVFFKSKWHRSHVPKLPDEKAVIISNGISL